MDQLSIFWVKKLLKTDRPSGMLTPAILPASLPVTVQENQAARISELFHTSIFRAAFFVLLMSNRQKKRTGANRSNTQMVAMQWSNQIGIITRIPLVNQKLN